MENFSIAVNIKIKLPENFKVASDVPWHTWKPQKISKSMAKFFSIYSFRILNDIRNKMTFSFNFDRVYCEYHYPQYKDFASPEERVSHFMNRAIKPAWRWKSLRPRPLDQHMYLGKKNNLVTLDVGTWPTPARESKRHPLSPSQERREKNIIARWDWKISSRTTLVSLKSV